MIGHPSFSKTDKKIALQYLFGNVEKKLNDSKIKFYGIFFFKYIQNQKKKLFSFKFQYPELNITFCRHCL